ncbi:hypothetical protein [Haliea sp. E17]|uniref:hypothetical protein n=1 Tax=Haliea sp. E17 TaxID=3401576 RepID=UPI003AAA660A
MKQWKIPGYACVSAIAMMAGVCAASEGFPDSQIYDSKLPDLAQSEPSFFISSVERELNNGATLTYRTGGSSGLSAYASYSYAAAKEDGLGASQLSYGENFNGYLNLGFSVKKTENLPALKVRYSVGGFDGYTGDDFSNEQRQMFSVSSSGSLAGILDQGFSYRSVGAEYAVLSKKNQIRDKDRDKATLYSWVGKSFGDLSIKQFSKQTETNIYSPNKPLTTDTLVGVEGRYTILYWPYVSASFAQASGDREVVASKTSSGDYDLGIDYYSASLSASHNTWSANLSVDSLNPEDSQGYYFGEPDTRNYYLGGSWYPNSVLSITPSIGFTTETFADYLAQTDTTWASLSFNYQPVQSDLRFSGYVSYDASENEEWYMDYSGVYSEVGVHWDLDFIPKRHSNLSLVVGYNRYEDGFYSAASSDSFSVNVNLVSYGLDELFSRRTSPTGRNDYGFEESTFGWVDPWQRSTKR